MAVRKDERFKRFYERIKHRKGPQKAIVATARKLLTIIYACWKNKTPYGEAETRPVAGFKIRFLDWVRPSPNDR